MSDASLQSTACELLGQQVGFCGPEAFPSVRLLPDLLDMVAERPSEPADQLRSVVRRLIVERVFACPSDNPMCRGEDEAIDAQADLLVRVLEQVRRRAVACGRWSEMPAAPLMCG